MRGVQKYEIMKIVKPELFKLLGGGALAQQHKDVRQTSGEQEKSEIIKIRKPDHAGTQKSADLRIDGAENPGVWGWHGAPGPIAPARKSTETCSNTRETGD